jgi:nucleoside-diphosphate-sugar epimerase
MNKTLVVGENSFIAKHLNNCDRVSYKDHQYVDFSNYDTVINCALNPLYKISPYNVDLDIDAEIGEKACESGCHFVMLSTSKVYGDSHLMTTYNENSEIAPVEHYGRNKLTTEFKLLSNFALNVTILRGSNIFGYEYGRNSFVGYLMSQLVNEGKIKFSIDPNTQRDFLFVEDAAKIIEKVCEVKPFGVFNLSSNQPITAKSIAKKLIEGYPYGGKIENLDYVPERQFALDNTKIKRRLGIQIGPFDFGSIFYDLGKQLYEQRH